MEWTRSPRDAERIAREGVRAGFERIVAIKRILPNMVEDDEFIKMFIDEARIASRTRSSCSRGTRFFRAAVRISDLSGWVRLKIRWRE